jgi:hypothetical protein
LEAHAVLHSWLVHHRPNIPIQAPGTARPLLPLATDGILSYGDETLHPLGMICLCILLGGTCIRAGAVFALRRTLTLVIAQANLELKRRSSMFRDRSLHWAIALCFGAKIRIPASTDYFDLAIDVF